MNTHAQMAVRSNKLPSRVQKKSFKLNFPSVRPAPVKLVSIH